jgi:hypothetical protein
MYLSNKYTVWYFNIINRAQQREIIGYFEKHHIIPKSLGGSNQKSNLVKLTAREHLICHLLLTKMTSGTANHKMVRAMFLMSTRGTINSRLYESLRKTYSLNRKLEQTGEKNHFYGKSHTKESIDKMKTSIQDSLTKERRAKIKYARTKWRHNQANKDLWAIADKLYDTWKVIETPHCFHTVAKQHGVSKDSIHGIIDNFVKGWIPYNDNDWLQWKEDYLMY